MFDWLLELLGFESNRQKQNRLRMEWLSTCEELKRLDRINSIKSLSNSGGVRRGELNVIMASKPKPPKSTVRNESTTPKKSVTTKKRKSMDIDDGDDDSSVRDFSDTGGVDISKWISNSDSSSHNSNHSSSHSHSYDSGSSSSPDSGSSSSGD